MGRIRPIQRMDEDALTRTLITLASELSRFGSAELLLYLTAIMHLTLETHKVGNVAVIRCQGRLVTGEEPANK